MTFVSTTEWEQSSNRMWPMRDQQQDYAHAKLLCNKQPVKSASAKRRKVRASCCPVAHRPRRRVIATSSYEPWLSDVQQHVVLTWHCR
ncbi:hypothetical protein PBY51_007974 [Eleginops maclovinus]|uniref:Uncharacterized protein n=1 Tax=Eleginops maclovinus TaxID=56733 RepID=A0AAN7X8L1_ELEMC|nr:hypothetical protein PBY51_007974 [Eleginops maclovinus]